MESMIYNDVMIILNKASKELIPEVLDYYRRNRAFLAPYEGVRDEKLVDTTLLEEYGDESDMSSLDEHMIECDCTRCVSNYSSYCTNPGILIVRKNKCAYCSSFKNR